MNEIFQLYNEPLVFARLITIFSCINYFLIFATLLYIIRLNWYCKSKALLTQRAIWFISAILTLINYNYQWYASIGTFLVLYIGAAYTAYRWIAVKSIRWINISMALFIIFIVATYNLFNTLIHRITFPFFSTNDILEYSFIFKPYFQAYNPKVNDLLGKVIFSADGAQVVLSNYPLEFRMYSFYYILNSIGVLTWLYIYFDVLRKHNLRLKEQITWKHGNFFFSHSESLPHSLKEPSYFSRN